MITRVSISVRERFMLTGLSVNAVVLQTFPMLSAQENMGL